MKWKLLYINLFLEGNGRGGDPKIILAQVKKDLALSTGNMNMLTKL